MAIEMTRGIPSGMHTIRRAKTVARRSMPRWTDQALTKSLSLQRTRMIQTTAKRKIQSLEMK